MYAQTAVTLSNLVALLFLILDFFFFFFGDQCVIFLWQLRTLWPQCARLVRPDWVVHIVFIVIALILGSMQPKPAKLTAVGRLM